MTSQDPKEQLWGAISAVFCSWRIPRAVTYRKLHDIPEEWGPSAAVAETLLMQTGVIVTPGSYYGPTCEHFLRLSFATSMTVIEEGLAELRKVLPLG